MAVLWRNGDGKISMEELQQAVFFFFRDLKGMDFG